jgi:hypothetical protein
LAMTECPECAGLVSDAAGTCPHCGFPTRPRTGSVPVIAWHHGLRHAVKALVLFPLIFFGMSVLTRPSILFSGSTLVMLGVRLVHVAVLGGVVAVLAVLIGGGLRWLFVRGAEHVDRWRWSESVVRVVVSGYALVVFVNMVLRRI